MGMATDMSRLREEIDRGKQERQETLERLRGDVERVTGEAREALIESRVTRTERAAQLKGSLQEQVQEIVSSVTKIGRAHV